MWAFLFHLNCVKRYALSFKPRMIQLPFKFKKSDRSFSVSLDEIEHGDKQIHNP